MRPVDLTPPELRRGDNAPLRTGPLAYVLLGALVLVLLGVTLLVLAGNEVSERQAEAVRLHREDSAAQAKADRLAAYTQFQAMTERRVATVSELADSRFDWERVMRELSLVLPRNVWLTELAASAAAGAGEVGGGEGGVSGISGPSLEMSGCATGQRAVAGFVTALKDIEGVTRVGLESSSVNGGGGEAGGGGGGEGCQGRDFIAQFQLVVAFDAAPTPITGEAGEVMSEAPPTESTGGAEEPESGEATSEGETSTVSSEGG